MSALITLGLRLARAGGPLRAWSIAAGNAIGVVLLLGALALPEAAYADPLQRAQERVSLLAILTFLLVPGGVLLVMVGRLSSGVRDQRLASLRMIGLSAQRTRVVAAVENGALALCGVLAGAVLFLAVVQPVSAVVARGPGGLEQGFGIGGLGTVLAVVGVVALSVVVATASTWDRSMPVTARSEAVRRVPGAWRLLVLAAGVSALVWLAVADVDTLRNGLDTVLLLGGTLVTGVGVALVTPLVTSWLSAALVRSGAVTPRLAGRAIQADSASASRVVAGLGVAVFLATGALGALSAFEDAPQNRAALRAFGDGPQTVWLTAGSDVVDPADVAEVLTVPGVLGIAPEILQMSCTNGGPCYDVLVGTCTQVELRYEITGCDDTRASAIADDDTGTEHVWNPERPEAGGAIDLFDEAGAFVQSVRIDGRPLVHHVKAQEEAWSWRSYAVAFVPQALLGDGYSPRGKVDVVAEGGTEMRALLADWAQARGLVTFHPDEADYASIMNQRAAVWTLCGIAIAVALVVLALGAVDRANERRRSVARQVMVGVPGRVLQGSQLLQVLIPVAVAVTLALGTGAIGMRGYANLAERDASLGSGSWLALALIAALGGLLAAASTLPLARARLTAELLRRE